MMSIKNEAHIGFLFTIFFVSCIQSSQNQHYILGHMHDELNNIVIKQNEKIEKSPLLKGLISFNNQKGNLFQDHQHCFTYEDNVYSLLFVPPFFDINDLNIGIDDLKIRYKKNKNLTFGNIIKLCNYADFFNFTQSNDKADHIIYLDTLYTALIKKINKTSINQFPDCLEDIRKIRNEYIRNDILELLLFNYLKKDNTALDIFFKKNSIEVLIKAIKKEIINIYNLSPNKNREYFPLLLSDTCIGISFLYKQPCSENLWGTMPCHQIDALTLYNYKKNTIITAFLKARISSNNRYIWGLTTENESKIFDVKDNKLINFNDFFKDTVLVKDLDDIFDKNNYMLCLKKHVHNNVCKELLLVRHNNHIPLGIVLYGKGKLDAKKTSVFQKQLYYVMFMKDNTFKFYIVWINPKDKKIYKMYFADNLMLIDKEVLGYLAWHNDIVSIKLSKKNNIFKIRSFNNGKYYMYPINNIKEENNIHIISLGRCNDTVEEMSVVGHEEDVHDKEMYEKFNISNHIDFHYKPVRGPKKLEYMMHVSFKNTIINQDDVLISTEHKIRDIQNIDNLLMIGMNKKNYICTKKQLKTWLFNKIISRKMNKVHE